MYSCIEAPALMISLLTHPVGPDTVDGAVAGEDHSGKADLGHYFYCRAILRMFQSIESYVVCSPKLWEGSVGAVGEMLIPLDIKQCKYWTESQVNPVALGAICPVR